MRAPSDRVIANAIARLLRRIKANETIQAAAHFGQEPPDWARDSIVATNGAVLEAKYILKTLRNLTPKRTSEQ